MSHASKHEPRRVIFKHSQKPRLLQLVAEGINAPQGAERVTPDWIARIQFYDIHPPEIKQNEISVRFRERRALDIGCNSGFPIVSAARFARRYPEESHGRRHASFAGIDSRCLRHF